MKRPSRRVLLIAAGLAGLAFCPIISRVSGEVVITVVSDSSGPFVAVPVRQTWGVYGWGGFGGSDTRVTNESGEVRFPPRYVIGFLGLRAVRRANAFLTQCGSILVFGHFGSEFTDRWGPIVGHELWLPPGIWLPATWDVAEDPAHDVLSPILNGGLHRYIYLHNVDLHKPTAYIGGDQLGFLYDAKITLRLRSATVEEEERVLRDPRRPDLLEMYRREGR